MDAKVKKLLAQMTLEEKVAQVNAVQIKELVDENNKFCAGKASKLLKNGIGQISCFTESLSILPYEAAELANEIQKYLKENTRLGIPAIVHEECLSGFAARGATAFPQAIGLASMWDPDAVRTMTEVIRGQMRAAGVLPGT